MPTSKSSRKSIGITLGDPSGIGPEITAQALAKQSIRRLASIHIIGDASVYRRFCGTNYANCTFVDTGSARAQYLPGKPTPAGARASLRALNKAAELIRAGTITALVTAPVCKESISRILPSFHGHTEWLSETFRVQKVGMMFVAEKMRTIIVTRHVPLREVSGLINPKNIYETIVLTDRALKSLFHIKKPAIGVCGLNPHAGEGGTIGREEITKIIPAIKQARRNNIKALGPFPADTAFAPGLKQPFDAIIAMYHDQGLIPVKSLYSPNLVNLTIGLPFVRTSPAHGTAFDIAGKQKANPASMCAAIKLAAQLA